MINRELEKAQRDIPAKLRESCCFSEDRQTLNVMRGAERSFDMLAYQSLLKRLGWVGSMAVLDAEGFELARQSQNEGEGDGVVVNTTASINNAVALIRDAADHGASDIHLRVNDSHADVLYRINGAMVPISQMPRRQAHEMCSTLYNAMSTDADANYKPIQPQSSRIASREYLPDNVHGVRLESCPKSGAVRSDNSLMVMRLLYRSTQESGGGMVERLERLGYSPEHMRTIGFVRGRPTGINIIAGPTGSGKSTTLKHVLESLVVERPDLNILTVEDPPEYPIAGVSQIPVTNADTDDKRKAAFSKAIRSALRLDPDVIMIGEIRDAESASLAVKAAMTGHQVWTTLHANSAFNILNRLMDIMESDGGVSPVAMLSDITVLTGLMFQKLVPTLCPHCKLPLNQHFERVDSGLLSRLDRVLDEGIEGVYLKNPEGCEHCRHTGVAGRSVLSEVVATDPEMLSLLRSEGVESARRYWLHAQQGRTALQHGLRKIRQGLVDPVAVEASVGTLDTDLIYADNTLKPEELHVV